MKSKKEIKSKVISNSELRIILKHYGTSLLAFTEHIGKSPSYFHNTCFMTNQPVPLQIVDKLIAFIGEDNYIEIYDNVLLPRRSAQLEKENQLKLRKEAKP